MHAIYIVYRNWASYQFPAVYIRESRARSLSALGNYKASSSDANMHAAYIVSATCTCRQTRARARAMILFVRVNAWNYTRARPLAGDYASRADAPLKSDEKRHFSRALAGERARCLL